MLKCYPKFQKNNVDVKANSSELSYLLYYASTRRSKLQKVGDFLDKRATTDVWKGRIGNVKVTLEILKALIEKCPRDLPLFAGAVLRVLATVLKSNDVTMVEDSVPTFESLCAHQDPANLAADQDYIRQYEETVQLYAQFASKDVGKEFKAPISWPVAIRFRKAGLRALKAVASSESLGSETGRQLAVIIPVILMNIHSDHGEYLKQLEIRERDKEVHDKEQTVRRRQSISTVRTNEEGEGDPIAASGTTEDADKLAEEEVGVVALQALRNLYMGVNGGQLRLATSAVLKFVWANVGQQHLDEKSQQNGGWATTLMSMICGWVPVQDRYAILVAAMENLVRSPIVEDDLDRQLILATIVQYLLNSPINFIGLSVMDVLVGLISHTLLLLQLGGAGTSILPHHQQTTPVTSERNLQGSRTPANPDGLVMEIVNKPSESRLQLVNTLQNCMASLATHVYYTDQISDMVAAILKRLKPSPASGVSSAAEAIEDPVGAANAVASSASLQEKAPHVDKFFSFETARLLALDAVKHIVITANKRRPDGSSASVSRAPIGVGVWEGTQWLLRDPSGKVRKAYVDALVTWLNLEKKKEDLKIVGDYRRQEKDTDKGGLARRAVSNASHRDKSPKREKRTFLPLLHLAIYENALHLTESEPDYLLLHLLLSTLVDKLGVNAVRSGLPMILRLQEDIADIDNPRSKVRIGSLVHGYLWALSMTLDFETSSVGRIVHAEISRRNSKGLWVQNIRLPAIPVARIETPLQESVQLTQEAITTEVLKPFDNRDALVDKIAEGYSTSLSSPPSSPPASPGRSVSMPTINPQSLKPPPQLSYKVREELLADWSRDLCLAANIKDSTTASMTGSRTGTSTHRKNNYLGVNIPNGTLDSATNSPLASPRRAHSRPPSTAYGLVGRVASPHRNRSPSNETPGSTSSLHSTVRVDDLKRVLSGSAPRTSYSMRPATNHRRHPDSSSHDSSASESLVSVHSLSDSSFVTTDQAASVPRIMKSNHQHNGESSALPHRPQSSHGDAPSSPTNSNSPSSNATREREAAYSRDGVPPVPPIPESLRDKSASPNGSATTPALFEGNGRPKTAPSNGNGHGHIAVRKSRSLKRGSAAGSVTSRSIQGGSTRERSRDMERGRGRGGGVKKPDFEAFLDSINVSDDETGKDEYDAISVRTSKVPY